MHRVFVRDSHMWNGEREAGLRIMEKQFAMQAWKNVAQTTREVWNTYGPSELSHFEPE